MSSKKETAAVDQGQIREYAARLAELRAQLRKKIIE